MEVKVAVRARPENGVIVPPQLCRILCIAGPFL